MGTAHDEPTRLSLSIADLKPHLPQADLSQSATGNNFHAADLFNSIANSATTTLIQPPQVPRFCMAPTMPTPSPAAPLLGAMERAVPAELAHVAAATPNGPSPLLTNDHAAAAPIDTVPTTTPNEVDQLHDMPMSHKDFVVIKLLGTGGFARVYLVQHASTGVLYAMKVMQKIYKPRVRKAEKRKAKKAAQTDAAAAASANNSPTPSPPGSPRAKIYVEGIKERDILASINNHPFLVTLRYAFQDDRHLYLLLDWVEGGELWYYVASEGMCLEDTACFYVAEIVLALEHLHSIGIIYRDLKLENILIDGTGHLKMTDFGLSKLAFDETFALKANSFCGTRDYMAPEMVLRKSYDEKLDVWGLGILLFIMLTGKLPFTGKTPKDLESAILNRKPQFPSFLTNEARDLITKLLRKDPAQRPSITAVKKHPFFRSIDWAKLARLEIPPPQVPPRSTIHEEVQALLGARRRRVHSVLTADGVTAIAAANFGDLAHPLEELQRVFQDFSFPARPKAPDDHRGEKRSGEDAVEEKRVVTSSESELVSEVEG